MNTFKRKSLYAALAGLGALGATGAAQAVNVNPDGLGQALIYPYYTTQGTSAPYNSLLSVVNSTNSGKVVKVRFLEGKNSKEVLDFNLWLSPRDVWTTAIIPMGAGAGIVTSDLSCTTPPIPAGGQAFTNVKLSEDAAGTGLDRTKEGYVEIIEMGNLTGATLTAITHVQPSPPGKPPGCAGLPAVTQPTDLVPGNGGLFGGISLINPIGGGDATADAVALASFSATTLWAPAGSILPDLSLVNPKLSVVFNNTATGSEVDTTDWSASSNTVDAVSAVLMHDNVYNEFVLDPGTASGTDWVVTFPTKHFYYNASNNVTKLFESNFRITGACDDILLTQYNREEQTVVNVPGFSPPSPTGVDALCWEANVITFNNQNVLLSANKSILTTAFQNGWVSLNFFPSTITGTVHQLIGGATIRTSTATGVSTVQATATYNGLPVIGFAAQSFNNGTIPGPTGLVQAHYVGTFIHKYTRLIQ